MDRIPLSRPEITDADRDAVMAVMASGRLALGPALGRFEAAMADTCAGSAALACSSGTAALYLALRGLGIGPGDEVITVSYTFVGTLNAILATGATPVLVDVDAETRNMDPALLEASITPRTRAVMPVHLFGRAAPMEAIMSICGRRRIHVIEDACEALGARIGDRPVGAIGTCGAFGFYPNKPITTGEGGALVSDDPELIARCRALANQGRRPGDALPSLDAVGFNFRLSEMAAALGASQLERLSETMDRRAAVAACYHEVLAGLDLLRPPLEVPGETLSWFVYVVELPDGVGRDRVRERLAQQGIETGLYFPAVHRSETHRARSAVRAPLPVTEQLAERCLALPFWPGLQSDAVERVAGALAELLSRR